MNGTEFLDERATNLLPIPAGHRCFEFAHRIGVAAA